jgi:hypothetical protein
MRIKSKPTAPSKAYERECARMEREKTLEIKAAKALMRERRELGLAGKHEGRVGARSRHAVLNAMRTEGKEIMTPEGEDYWRFLRRKYPWQNPDGVPESTDSVNGHRNRFGKVARRYVPGKGWMRWERGTWRREENEAD